ncbi:HEPN domain-containing protein [Lachnospiraceae bacterium 48-42]
MFPKTIGRKLGILKQIREDSDYDDFYIASKEEAHEQIETAKLVLEKIQEYLKVNQ